MYPSRLRYAAPRSLDEALDLLGDAQTDARVLAGGQSLIPLVKLRFAAPELLVDINHLTELDYLRESADGALAVGALCRHRDLERSASLAETQPTLSAAAPLIADPLVRNRGTLVGSLCHADPQGDWCSALLALGGEIVATGPDGQRSIPAKEFVTGPFQNSLAAGEIATEARIPAARGQRRGTYLKLERRVGDFATVGVALATEISGGTVARAGIALTGVGPTTLAASAAARALIGTGLGSDVIERAAELAAEAAQPASDHRGSAEYKRHVVATFVRRGLRSTQTPATEEVAA